MDDLRYFTFSQNNSGGFFIGPHHIFVRARNLEQACVFAQKLSSFFPELDVSCNVYFDGVDNGLDCPCCGDRWSMPYDENGTIEPMLYGKCYSEYSNHSIIIADPLNNHLQIQNYTPDKEEDE